MKKAEIHSLLSLPCYRIVEEEWSFGTLECQENQVRFVEKNRIFSISFYKIENIELRHPHEGSQIVFLTHVGLIIFYFYEDTPRSHISYIHNAILGAFDAYQNRSFARPIWSGYFFQTQWAQPRVLVSVYSSKITIKHNNTVSTFAKESIRSWIFKKKELSIHSETIHVILHGAHLPLLKNFSRAILDGSIQGFWESTHPLNFKREVLILSEQHLYFYTHSWFSSHQTKLSLAYIHSIRHTRNGIVFSSLEQPYYTFYLTAQQSHIFAHICGKIVKQDTSKDIFLWQRQSLLRGTLSETVNELIVHTHQEVFRWPWNTLCRDDDVDSQPNVLSLRNSKESIRIYTCSSSFCIKKFYTRHMLPHRRIQWTEFSKATQQAYTNEYVHIHIKTTHVRIVAHIKVDGGHFCVTPLSSFTLINNQQEVFVHFHTQHGQYSFSSILKQQRKHLTLSIPTYISLTSQRHTPRYRTERKTVFSLLSLDHSTKRWSSKNDIFSAQLINISENGACILSPIPLTTTQRILLDIDEYPQQIICQVRHCTLSDNAEFQIGLMFFSVSHQTRKNINEMLNIFVKEKH